ncbi:helix-turn-helix transcriptional regulator [Pediococcus argentinicus]|uniref:helix-turn-helix domain-containing protein n=1 Tax=Pediococcus argentinicus TaxID=480391 RepID=UPI00338D87A7
MNISEKLKKCRLDNNMTQADVAEKLNVSRKSISGWENNRNYPDISNLVTISKLYNISLDDLLDDDRIVQHYKMQTKINHSNRYITTFFYIMNIVFLLLGYIELFKLFNINIILIPLLLLVNTVLLLIHYDNWHNLSNKKPMIKITLTFILHLIVGAIIFEFALGYGFVINLDHEDVNFINGFLTGKFFLLILLTISFTSVFFLHPTRKN